MQHNHLSLHLGYYSLGGGGPLGPVSIGTLNVEKRTAAGAHSVQQAMHAVLDLMLLVTHSTYYQVGFQISLR
jgi:hypothetical protein